VRLTDVNAARVELLCHFKVAVDIVRGSIREFVYDTDRPAFLKREMMGFRIDRYQER
jgi:hypothetical protein